MEACPLSLPNTSRRQIIFLLDVLGYDEVHGFLAMHRTNWSLDRDDSPCRHFNLAPCLACFIQMLFGFRHYRCRVVSSALCYFTFLRMRVDLSCKCISLV